MFIVAVVSIDCYVCLGCHSDTGVKKSCPQDSRSCMTTTEVFNNRTVGNLHFLHYCLSFSRKVRGRVVVLVGLRWGYGGGMAVV